MTRRDDDSLSRGVGIVSRLKAAIGDRESPSSEAGTVPVRKTPMTSHIKLYGSKSTRFEEIKASMEQQLGYEPSNPEVVGLIMAAYETDETSALRVDNALL